MQKCLKLPSITQLRTIGYDFLLKVTAKWKWQKFIHVSGYLYNRNVFFWHRLCLNRFSNPSNGVKATKLVYDNLMIIRVDHKRPCPVVMYETGKSLQVISHQIFEETKYSDRFLINQIKSDSLTTAGELSFCIKWFSLDDHSLLGFY